MKNLIIWLLLLLLVGEGVVLGTILKVKRLEKSAAETLLKIERLTQFRPQGGDTAEDEVCDFLTDLGLEGDMRVVNVPPDVGKQFAINFKNIPEDEALCSLGRVLVVNASLENGYYGGASFLFDKTGKYKGCKSTFRLIQ